MSIIDYAKKRYSTKIFQANRDISEDNIVIMKDLLRLSPSSTNLQPWHFIFSKTTEGKERIAKAADGLYSFNKQKILDASVVVVFCGCSNLNEDYLSKLTEQENIDGRFQLPGVREKQHAIRSMFVNIHQQELHDHINWVSRQVYLNLGSFLLGVATLGLDAVPIEGFDSNILDNEFNLKSKNLFSLAIVSVGYHSIDDYNAQLPKSRLPIREILTEI